ncbi:hypothetical protein OGR47_11550 [Methylocystis sp. MJC1]|jgi:hypothetical protein|uniref:hypothetical protein n=1 Tax=Methylocystis sp. MJC1 TaxID=2654282 RepID=UPI0019D2E1DC|nr:hypothetical protein [Methylocystis sp. MJC1]KAF2990131.1 hypothetical protein MJC1_02791 [Methylocystis sp. MJC1]MBU6527614.1 hypothetical protein [Methylocystis sp. MJC1]UZX10555.1 hypothetical protein OGR47_11550 [Methylocystis sp. MJC1]
MARLIYVPVLHSVAEMGAAAPAYKAAFIARHGEAKWTERCAAFDAIWRSTAEAIKALGLDLRRVKLYQDSLPVCDKESELVSNLAAQGSPNHQLLESLMRGGATLVGTESPALLLDEYKLLQSSERTDAKAAALLDARDRFIAERISQTLGEEEVGLLFIGALHRVARFLPQRIKVDYVAVRSELSQGQEQPRM